MFAMAEPAIRKIWGIAKSKELRMSDDELHAFVSAHTGKDSLKELNKHDCSLIVGLLLDLKDRTARGEAGKRRIRGNTGTVNQRKKVFYLSRLLGWEGNRKVNAMCQKMFSIDRVEWLDYTQCSALIEALKSMASRKGGADEGR